MFDDKKNALSNLCNLAREDMSEALIFDNRVYQVLTKDEFFKQANNLKELGEYVDTEEYNGEEYAIFDCGVIDNSK